MVNSTEKEIQEINRKLDTVMSLMAYQLVKEMTLTEGAPILKRLGFKNTEIAKIFSTSSKTISVVVAKAKRKSKK